MLHLVGYGSGVKVANISSDIGENKDACTLCRPSIENGNGKRCEFEIIRFIPLLTLSSPGPTVISQSFRVAEVVYLQLGF